MKIFLVASGLALVACGASSSPVGPGDSAAPPPGGPSSLTGMYGFPVHFSLVLPAGGGCSYPAKRPNGDYNSISVALSGATIGICADAASAAGAAGQPFVLIQVASPSYATDPQMPDGGEQPLTPGTYSIAFEKVTDDDLCMLSGTSGTALVDVRDFDDGGQVATPVATALSGAVTLTAVGGGHVAGAFNVTMGAATNNSIDTQHPVAFSGTFDATECPGTAQ
jgi:hypothetical protein